jgi:hypothetical protein
VALDADDIQALLERTPEWVLSRGVRVRDLQHPLGLTWAWAIESDADPYGQRQAMDIANSRAVEKWLEDGGDAWADDWDYDAGGIVIRLLDENGQPTAVAEDLGPALLDHDQGGGLIDEDLASEVEDEHWTDTWEREVLDPIRNEGKIQGWRNGRVWYIDFDEVEEDDLPDDWEEQLDEAYRYRESSPHYDDQGYAGPDMDTVAEVIDRLGWLAETTIPEAEAQAIVDRVLEDGEVSFDEWSIVQNEAGFIHLIGSAPHPVVQVLQDRRLRYFVPRDRGE